MEILNNNIEKLCSFYVSDWHLVTMLLPYINKEINENANIINKHKGELTFDELVEFYNNKNLEE